MRSLYKHKGVTSIEFVMGAIVLFFVTFAIFESCYKIYVVNMTEYALRETIRNTKIYQGNSVHERYKETFRSLIEQENNLWHFLVDPSRFNITGRYFLSYNDFIVGNGVTEEDLGSSYDLAEITVTYSYSPMFRLSGAGDSDISRTMVLNLEHEGWQNDAP
ncbi:TadE family protein [Vibrio sp. AND4]|uniref:TadE family protein n=1 Tax=Vibrio sp. AND4 TaxID=314289 RepID=UPI00015EFEB1|nr:TadE family protein [Vibrio sp. AND4]EDP59389.1 TadE-like protein [Vibrio sp. AND4]